MNKTFTLVSLPVNPLRHHCIDRQTGGGCRAEGEARKDGWMDGPGSSSVLPITWNRPLLCCVFVINGILSLLRLEGGEEDDYHHYCYARTWT